MQMCMKWVYVQGRCKAIDRTRQLTKAANMGGGEGCKICVETMKQHTDQYICILNFFDYCIFCYTWEGPNSLQVFLGHQILLHRIRDTH